MTYRVEVTTRASQDLDHIYRYIQAEESHQAATWFNGLYTTLQSLSNMPHRAPTIRENPSQHHLLYGTRPHIYRIIYVIDDTRKQVTILSIRHRARNSFETK
jgi:toxin ParE1/3/4